LGAVKFNVLKSTTGRTAYVRDVARRWLGWPKPPPIPSKKNYKAKTTYSIYNVHIALTQSSSGGATPQMSYDATNPPI